MVTGSAGLHASSWYRSWSMVYNVRLSSLAVRTKGFGVQGSSCSINDRGLAM